MQMTYDEFKQKTVAEILNYLPDEFKNCEVTIRTSQKTNETLDALLIMPSTENGEGEKRVPVLYLNLYYKDMEKNYAPYEAILQGMADGYLSALNGKDIQIDVEINEETMADHLYCTVINLEKNVELLKRIPHRIKHDLAIVCHWLVKKDSSGLGSARITNEVLEKRLQIDAETLIDFALENTKKLFPVKIKSMSETIFDMLVKEGVSEDDINNFMNMTEGSNMFEEKMYVISNEIGMNGAINMMFNDVLQSVFDKIKDNYYILPSSIHEVIAVNCFGDGDVPVTAEQLRVMVKEVNQTQVGPGEFLSNNIYYYERLSGELTKVEI